MNIALFLLETTAARSITPEKFFFFSPGVLPAEAPESTRACLNESRALVGLLPVPYTL